MSEKRIRKSGVGSPKSEVKRADKSENLHNEIKLRQTANSKLPTEITMEVHHHPQLEHKPKPWKEYLFEGLMIFLAVMMGFFAESLREHITDQHRERGFMVSMIEDLKSDTVTLASNINFRKHRVEMIDSLVFLLGSPSLKDKGNSVYYFARVISPPQNIFPNDRTIQQLKSSGSLRLISNWKISNNIMAYDQKMRVQILEMNEEQMLREDYRQYARKIFDTRIFNSMVAGDKIIRPTTNPQLFSTNPALLNEYIGSVQYLKKSDETQRRRAGELLVQAKKLIGLINNEYHLKESEKSGKSESQ
ncbi:MAG: hypothetical protein JWP94_2521 [Mucilaginibacter sp.]|nr:hypothetical protein [Mucilaginibacter sp.]